MIVLGIDPGPRTSGGVIYSTDQGRVIAAWTDADNDALLTEIGPVVGLVCVERVKFYGPNVNAGRDVYETCEWYGAYRTVAALRGVPFAWRYRPDVNRALTGLPTAKKSQVRTAIADRFGGKAACKGTKADPGPLYGLTGHAWDGLAVALVVLDELTPQPGEQP